MTSWLQRLWQRASPSSVPSRDEPPCNALGRAPVDHFSQPLPAELHELVISDTSGVHPLGLDGERGPFASWISVRAVGERATKKWACYVRATTVEGGPFNALYGVMALAGKRAVRNVDF